ncbi:MAG TPA: hypothetical protein GX743_09885 [Actinomycetales bacterium]|nr:hypothetical protein [Actinomycetales bacterium]
MVFEAIGRQFSKDVRVEVIEPRGGAFNRWDRELHVCARVTALRDVTFSRVRIRLVREHHYSSSDSKGRSESKVDRRTLGEKTFTGLHLKRGQSDEFETTIYYDYRRSDPEVRFRDGGISGFFGRMGLRGDLRYHLEFHFDTERWFGTKHRQKLIPVT